MELLLLAFCIILITSMWGRSFTWPERTREIVELELQIKQLELKILEAKRETRDAILDEETDPGTPPL